MARQLKQHQQSATTEHSETGSKAKNAAQRTAARQVRVTGTDITHKSTAKNAAERALETLAANGHTPGVPVGLAQAAALEGRSTKELTSEPNYELGTGLDAAEAARNQVQ